MLTPTYVNLKSFFYPIGNTPAANLLRDYRPHDAVKVLAIGCGDVRNILFTLWSNQGAEYTFDFTACDSDPAVLGKKNYPISAPAEPVCGLALVIHANHLNSPQRVPSDSCCL